MKKDRLVASDREFARQLRADTLRMIHRARSSHVGSCLSMADIVAVLYGSVLSFRSDEPTWPERDRLIVSKGHAAAIVYAALARKGFFPVERLTEFGQDGTELAGHVTSGVPGVEVSTGSLGHGLPIAAGMALSAKRDGKSWRVFALLSDGECDEGSVWEAILFAAHHQLGNLALIVDYNGIQSLGRVDDTLGLEPLRDKLHAFGWEVADIDGHDTVRLKRELSRVGAGRPRAVIARTVKGKGVSFMEGRVEWHYRPPSGDELSAALLELGVQP